MKTKLLAPWCVNDQCYRVNVSSIEIELQRPWRVYLNYPYLAGVDTELSRIPRHCWGLTEPGNELFRVPRVVHFVDASGCIPVSQEEKTPPAFYRIRTIEDRDHTTYWYGPSGEPFILREPYDPDRAEIEEEIKARKLSAVVLPDPGLYAGGDGQTCSVLMGLPEDCATLHDIVATLNLTGWPAMPEVKTMDWIDAARLSKTKARGGCHA